MDENSGTFGKQACNGEVRTEWIDSKVDAGDGDISNNMKKLNSQKFVVVLNIVQIPHLI